MAGTRIKNLHCFNTSSKKCNQNTLTISREYKRAVLFAGSDLARSITIKICNYCRITLWHKGYLTFSSTTLIIVQNWTNVVRTSIDNSTLVSLHKNLLEWASKINQPKKEEHYTKTQENNFSFFIEIL